MTANDQKFYTSYKKDIVKILNKKRIIKQTLDYDEAEKIIVDYLSQKKHEELTVKEGNVTNLRNLTKEQLREEKKRCREMIVNCILQNGFSIRGYTSEEKIEEFINEMVNEYSGYSILNDAFDDPDVDDIFCIEWNKIYVERRGRNEKYHKTFKNKKHYQDIVERFARKAGKEINMGDNKIVDFELYGDRVCATSPATSPKDYSMTIRKHREDHIQLDDLLYQEVLNEEIAEFFGISIDGESNIIYAGITGTGKTTTIRALLDYFVTKNNKRMIVCEDTPELFPKNDHTLQFVTCRSDDKKADISLYRLIITALRLKPKYIVVGEVRGEEAVAAVEAMETGHSTIMTMHGKKSINIINRLVNKFMMGMPELGIDVVERIIGSAIDFIAIQDHIPDVGRKVTCITEVKFDDITKRVVLTDLLVYDFIKEDWVWLKRIDSDKCRNFMRRGVKKERVLKWMETDDPETEKKALEELNNTYYREKAERLARYQKEHEEKLRRKEEEKLRKKQSDSMLLEEKLILASEKTKQKELEDMKLKLEKVIEYDEQINR